MSTGEHGQHEEIDQDVHDGLTLHRLVLVSRSSMRGDDVRTAGVAAIVASGHRHNAAGGVAGILAVDRNLFLLALEGSETALAAAWKRIAADDRHEDVRLLENGPVPERRLPDVPMLLVGLDKRMRALLPNRSKGAAVADRHAPGGDAVVEVLLAAAAQSGICPPNGGDSGGLTAVTQPEARRDAPRLQADLSHALSAPAERAGCPQAEAVTAHEASAEAEALDAAFPTAVISAQGDILRINAPFATLLGYVADELAGRPYRDILPEAEADQSDRLWPALRRGETVRIDRRAARRDGGEIRLRSVYRPRLDGAGLLRDVVEIVVDVTEQSGRHADDRRQVRAIDEAQLVLHLDLDGTVIDANDLFLDAMGYERGGVIGRHHRMFFGAEDVWSGDYAAFWTALVAGQRCSTEVRRIAGDGSPIWLRATYDRILDTDGQPVGVIEYATIVTDEALRLADLEGQITAIHKAQAVVTFDMNAVIIDANDAFLDAMGYARDQIVGRHHRMFVDPAHAHSAEYAAFWRALAAGRHQAGQFRRLGRDGREIWLQATYNPIFGVDGRPVKVVKYATVVTDEKLRQADLQGQIAAIHKGQAVIAFALDGTVVDANDNFLDAMGYRLSEVLGQHHRMFVDPVQAKSAAYANFWAHLAAGRHEAGEFRRVAKDGRDVWLQATYNPILDMNGRPFRIIKYATDVTAEKMRQTSIDGLITAIDKSQGMITFDLDGTIIEANDNVLAMLGYEREELVGHHHRILVDKGYAASQDYAAFWRILRAGSFSTGRYDRIAKDGRKVWLQATYNPILDLHGRPFKVIKLATDVTADVSLAQAYEDAKREAHHDAATALPNRVRLASYMAGALAQPDARLVVLYIDLDRFKPINDTFGHHAGDRVLGEVADRLRRALAADQIAARVGGDEFVVAAPDMPDDAIEAFCQRLIDLVVAPIRHEGTELTVGASIGVAISPADGTSPDALLRAADTALYRSKQNGRGTFSYYAAAMNDRVLAYRCLVDDLRRGIADAEFFLEYQPRFSARDRTVQSVEALVRWSHPQRGLIPPADFIPLAEKCGLIVPLGEWVLRTACRAATAWANVGISVNVSPIQLRESDVVAIVTEILAETGLDPHCLELEITEGVLMEDAERARTELLKLKRLGVRLAMDDFGTGYSSLSSLRTLPFDVIKIDRQFIADIDSRDGGREVVQAILGLGKALDMSVTAEGVETSGQLAILADGACEEVQGYYLAQPMAPAQILDMLADGFERQETQAVPRAKRASARD